MRDDRSTLFSIGEFSRITGLTVKTLRFYHEQGLLEPAFVDPGSGYRYYDVAQIDPARIISHLRSLEFPIEQIRTLLQAGSDESRILEAMEEHQALLEERIRNYQKAVRSIRQFISEERQARAMGDGEFQVQEKSVDPLLVAAVRMRGKYSECGKAFAKIGRAFGRYIAGPPMLLHHDSEYKEEDADFEACMPVKQAKSADGIDVRQLPGGRCVALLHKGPYEQLGASYSKILQHIKSRNYRALMPTREVYLKGPGMIFRGNPANYLTEIQMLVDAAQPA